MGQPSSSSLRSTRAWRWPRHFRRQWQECGGRRNNAGTLHRSPACRSCSSCPGTALLSRSGQEADGDDTGGRFLPQDVGGSSAELLSLPRRGAGGTRAQRAALLQLAKTLCHTALASFCTRLPHANAPGTILGMACARTWIRQPVLGCTLLVCQEPANCCPAARATCTRKTGNPALVPWLCLARVGEPKDGWEGSSPQEGLSCLSKVQGPRKKSAPRRVQGPPEDLSPKEGCGCFWKVAALGRAQPWPSSSLRARGVGVSGQYSPSPW